MPLAQTGPLVGAILAGGQSRRMGRPKEGVRLAADTFLIEPALQALSGIVPTVVVVGACQGYDLSQWPSIVHLLDRQPGMGPLSGIQTLLASGLGRGYIVAACDQPGLSMALLEKLSGQEQGRFFRGADRIHPLPGYYPAAWLPDVDRAMRSHRRSLFGLLEMHAVDWVPLSPAEEACLQNLNTPEEVENFQRSIR